MAFLLSWQAEASYPGRPRPPAKTAIYADQADAEAAKLLREGQGFAASVTVAEMPRLKEPTKQRWER
jgi:hypothetical protein